MSKGTTLEELHRFFEDHPDDHQLETQAESRLKALYNCLVNGNSRTTLEIGLAGLLTYVKASQRSSIIDDLLLSKDYISEIITMAADNFLFAPLLSATCLYECMMNYPKKFSPFLINKFRPLLPRFIYKKISGPNEICCKCLAQLSILGIPSSSKQAKSWRNEYEHYLKIASLLIDQLYGGINEILCSDTNDIESALTKEIGDLISPTDYAAIFSNCCHVLKNLLHVQLDSSVVVPVEQTWKLIFKLIQLNTQQFNIVHRKQHLSVLVGPCLQLCDALVAFNSSSLMFELRAMLTSIISLLDLVRPHAEYLNLSIRIYEILTNLFAIYHRQIRLDTEILQKLIRWIIHDSTMRPRTKISLTNQTKSDHQLTRVALNCTQQLLNIYSDHMPKDQYILIQNHCLHTLMSCQSTNAPITKPYDDELCRVNLYQTLESLLINERADCPTIIGISKDFIDRAILLDSSIKVKIIVRKLKLIWQQVRDSTSHFYQPWSFLNVDKPRTTISNSNFLNNELHHIFVPPSVPLVNNLPSSSSSISMMNTDQPALLTKPMLYEPEIEPSLMATHALPTTSYAMLTSSQSPTIEAYVPRDKTNEYDHISEQKRKRTKFIDTRTIKTDDDDDDGAEQIFADEHDDEDETDDDEEIDESDEVDDDDDDDDDHMDEENDSDMPSSEDDGQHQIHSNGLTRLSHHLGIHETNVDLLDVNRAPTDSYSHIINEKLHKKFRRSKLEYPNLHPPSEDFSSIVHHQINGDHKTNPNLSTTTTNGQGTLKNNAIDNDDDDDDVVVLVSDDDDDDNHCAKKFLVHPQNLSMEMKKSNVTHFQHESEDLLENIGRPSCSHLIHIETSTVNESNAASPSAIQETVEALRDAIALVNDDYSTEN